jgi:hypothetical protein
MVSESIPSGVTEDFFPKVETEPCALGSTQPLEMCTRKTPGGEGGRCVRVTTLPPSLCRKSRRSRSLNLLEPQEPFQACSGKPLTFPLLIRYVITLHNVKHLLITVHKFEHSFWLSTPTKYSFFFDSCLLTLNTLSSNVCPLSRTYFLCLHQFPTDALLIFSRFIIIPVVESPIPALEWHPWQKCFQRL